MNRKSTSRFAFASLSATVLCFSSITPISAHAGEPCEPLWDNTLGQPGVGWPGVLNAEWVEDMTEYAGDLIAGGNFVQANDDPFFRIARWDAVSKSWQPFVVDDVIGMNDHVWNLIEHDGDLIAGGNFTMAGVKTVNHIARWNDDSGGWHALNGGMSGGLPGQPFSVGTPTVTILAEYKGNLIAGGNFTTAGDVTVNHIARWDAATETWHALGGGMNAPVTALAVHNGDLIAGGSFTMAGGVTANRVARWDGASWHAIGGGMNTWVLDLAVHNGTLVAGGLFTDHIMRWDESSGFWRPIGGGMGSGVWDVFAHNGVLYAGGTFTIAGGMPADYIARWDPDAGGAGQWLPMGSGMNWNVYAMTEYQGDLIVGGRYTTAGGEPSNRVAAWRACQPCPGDLNGDDEVNIDDLLIVLNNWGECPGGTPGCAGDLNGDGDVNVDDLLIVLNNWGACP